MSPTNQGRLPDTFSETLADGLTNIDVEMHADRRARETQVSESSRLKTFREKYGDRSDDSPPPFYQELGGKKNGDSEPVILQKQVGQSADAFDVLAFKVYSSQVISLKTCDFVGMSLS
jgi:hypothetical protein